MLTIERATSFKRDYKRERRGRYREEVEGLLSDVIERLASGKSLPERSRDHALSGDWCCYRECHIKPDLLLIYRKPDAATLELVRLGSHSELFR